MNACERLYACISTCSVDFRSGCFRQCDRVEYIMTGWVQMWIQEQCGGHSGACVMSCGAWSVIIGVWGRKCEREEIRV